MQQPSAQGIASLFRGNPAPLQQRIQMEQQGKPGLPPDLQKLLALNIVTNEKDAVAKQQAMDQLNQMQGQQGKPPTVMESVQEQARQKMQAQQVQAQRQQQAMQAMMQQAGPGPVPPGTPQPEAQPQGIDELPVEFSMAEGGIIAFQEGKRVPRIQDEPTISDEERVRLERELLMRIIGEEARNPPERKVPMQMTESDLMSVPGMEQSDLMARALRDAAGPQPDNRAMLNAIERREPRAPYTGPKSESLNERAARQMKEKGSIYDKDFGIPPAERATREARRQEAISQIPTGGEPTVTGGERVRGSETERNILNTLAALPGAGAAKATTVGRQALAGIASLLGMDKSSAPERAAPAAAAQAAPSPAEESGYSKEGRTGARPYTPAPKPIQDLKSLAEKERRQQAPRPAPTAPVAPVAPVAETPAAPQFQDSITMQGVLNQADAARLRGQSEYEEKIGRPSSAALDKLMAEYESQKAAAQGPQEGFGRLMEYLGQIAATPRGMSSFEAGAAGARGVRSLEKERAAQRAGLTEKQIGLEQKRMDMDRQYAKDLLGVGNAEYDRALKANLSLFEEEGKSKRQAMSDASAMTRDQFKAQADKDLAAIRFNYDRQVRAMPSAEERFRKEAIAAYKKAHPGADDFTVLKAIGAYSDKSGAAGERNDITAIKAIQSSLQKELSENLRMDAATRARKQAELDKTYADLARLGGVGTPTTQAGKVVDFSSLPK